MKKYMVRYWKNLKPAEMIVEVDGWGDPKEEAKQVAIEKEGKDLCFIQVREVNV